jgi:hypothetical protein
MTELAENPSAVNDHSINWDDYDARGEMLNLLANILKDNVPLDVLRTPADPLHQSVVQGLHACLDALRPELIAYCQGQLEAAAS